GAFLGAFKVGRVCIHLVRRSMRRRLFVLGWIIALGFFDHHFARGAEIWGPFVKKQGGKECLPLKGQHPPYPVMDERYLCILAGVSGELKGGGEAIRVYFDDKNPQAKQWNLCVRSKQIGVLGEAYCFSRDSFLTDTDQGGVRMLSEEFKSTVTPSGGCNGREA